MSTSCNHIPFRLAPDIDDSLLFPSPNDHPVGLGHLPFDTTFESLLIRISDSSDVIGLGKAMDLSMKEV